MPQDKSLRSDRIEQALRSALAGGPHEAFFDALERASGLPGLAPNLELARAVGLELAAAGRRGEAVIAGLLRHDSEFPVVVGVMSLAARWSRRVDPRDASDTLQQLAEDERRHVRPAVAEALRDVIRVLGGSAVDELAAWTDGFYQAHVALEALADRTLLAALPGVDAVLARLDEAFVLADRAGRAADRAPGVRALRRGLPVQIAVFAARDSEVLLWLSGKTAAKRPETREVLEHTMRALRKAGFAGAEVDRLASALATSAPPPRDPTRVVAGTRRRSRGR